MREGQIDLWNLVNWFVLPSPLLMSLSVAIMAAGLVPPRPPVCMSCAGTAGFTTCWTASLVMAIDAAVIFAMESRMPYEL